MIKEALQARAEGHHLEAARRFFELTKNGGELAKAAALTDVGVSLLDAGYHGAASSYLFEALARKKEGPHVVMAANGLARIGRTIEDDVLIPAALRQVLADDFGKLKPPERDWAQYMAANQLALLAQPKAHTHLSQVARASPYYGKARYQLGVLALKRAPEAGANPYTEAIAFFEEARVWFEEQKDSARADLARISVARALYSQGDFEGAERAYEAVASSIPDAEAELLWAQFRTGKKKEALRGLEKLDVEGSPEIRVLEAALQYELGDFERAIALSDSFVKAQEAALARFENWDATLDFEEDPAVPEYVRIEWSVNRRLLRWRKMVESIEAEEHRAKKALATDEARPFLDDLLPRIRDASNKRKRLTKRLVENESSRYRTYLEDFIHQIEVIRAESLLALGWPARVVGAPAQSGGADRVDEVRLLAGLSRLEALLPQYPERRRAEVLFRLFELSRDLGEKKRAAGLAADARRMEAEAFRHGQALMDGYPKSAWARRASLWMGDQFFARGQLSEARAAYLRVRKKGAKNEAAYARYSLAWCDFAEGKQKEAQASMRKVLELASKLKAPDLEEAARADLRHFSSKAGR